MPGGPTLTEILSRPLSRRRLLAGTGTAALVLAAQQTDFARDARRLHRLPADPFSAGRNPSLPDDSEFVILRPAGRSHR